MSDHDVMLLVKEILGDLNAAIDNNHENGFVLVNLHRKLTLLNKMLDGVLDSEIEEFRTLIESKRGNRE